ncbi:hypothetical protein FACS1894187_14090 [Synergistales bacterium]|nr:hypothetical protein FACS1894187_14090 [Synergistales bacterium]
MLVNMFKKSLLVMFAVVILASAAYAAPKSSGLVGGKKEADLKYTKTTPDGLDIAYKGVWKRGNTLEAYFGIVSKKDARVSVEFNNSVLQDANDISTAWNTGKWSNERSKMDVRYNGSIIAETNQSIGAGAYITDDSEQGYESEEGKSVGDYAKITADEPYTITLKYWVPDDYLITPTFKSITIAINGLPTVFKDVPVAP